MIGTVSTASMADVMAGITGQMTGLNLADAWSQQEFQDPVAAEYGVDFGVDVVRIGGDKPAITGYTADSIADSAQFDPVDAFNDYVLNNPDSVDSTTGGVVEGSNVYAMAYSLLQTHPQVGTEVVKAVVPVAVPIERAYVAISQALGVSMDAAQMEVETKQAFANSIVNGNNLIYDKAKGLVKAWWDGVNILFPRKTVEAVQETINDIGIGFDASAYLSDQSSLIYPGVYPALPIEQGLIIRYSEYNPTLGQTLTIVIDYSSATVVKEQPGSSDRTCYIISLSPFHTRYTVYNEDGSIRNDQVSNYNSITWTTRNGTPVYGFASSIRSGYGPGDWELIYGRDFAGIDVITIVIDGNIVGGGYPEGTSESKANKYTSSSIPSAGGIALSDSDTLDVVPINLPENALKTTESTVDPIETPTDSDEVGTLPVPPIPLPIPDTNVSNPDVPLVNPSVVDSTLVDALVEDLANTLDPQPPQSSGLIPIPLLPGIPDGQGGSSYPSIVPSSGSGLIHVYNPTPAEMVSFGNWLWVTYADATIDKIWNNPFDGIIGAHELYSTPQTDGVDNIRSGFLVCPTTSALVRQRYTEIDCGTIIVPEFYGNYLDYSPYSQAYIYLPFIGINEVSIDDIVGHAINIRYRVDAYNGSCIAMIWVAKNGYRNLCYQFAGNCAVEVPLAGGSQAAIKAGMLQAEAYARAAMMSAGAHVLGGVGSALMGSIGGALSSIGSIASDYANAKAGVESARVANKSSVQHSGSFGASHGAMGQKIPFIIIRNPIQVKVVNYNDDYGFPAHKRVIVGGCTGYLRVREVNVISANATDDEKAMIEALLKNGVYVQ